MAISFPSHTRNSVTTGTTFDLAKPSTGANNDYFLIVACKDDDPLFNTPTGFTEWINSGVTVRDDLAAGVYYKKITDWASETAVTLSWSDSEECVAQLLVVRGAAETFEKASSIQFYGDEAALNTNVTDTSLAIGDVTITFGAARSDRSVDLVTAPSGYTLLGGASITDGWDRAGTGNGDAQQVMAYKTAVSVGTENPGAFGGIDNADWLGYTLAIRAWVFPSHSSDVVTSFAGSVNGMINPGTIHGTSTNGYSSWFEDVFHVQWGANPNDRTQLIGRVWGNWNPKATGYTYKEAVSHTFTETIVHIETSFDGEWVAIQLADGSVHLGKYRMGRSSVVGSDYYINTWYRYQGVYANGPSWKPREIVGACSGDTPAKWGIALNGVGADVQWVAFNWEPVGGVEKVWWTHLVYDMDSSNQWGDSSSFGGAAVDGMWGHPPQMIDPSNTTDDERICDIPFVVKNENGGVSTGEKAEVAQVLYTKEGSTQTYLYQQTVTSPRYCEIWSDATSGAFTLKFANMDAATESSSISFNETATSFETKIEAMGEIRTATVTGGGTKANPWLIEVTAIETSGGLPTKLNYFYVGGTDTLNGSTGLVIGTSPDDPIGVCEVKHQTIPKVNRLYAYLPGTGTPSTLSTASGSFSERIVWYAQTNGKLGAHRVANGRTGDDWTPDKPVLWAEYATDATTGSVHVDGNGVVAVAPYVSVQKRLHSEQDTYSYVYDAVIAVDDSTRDLILVARNRLWHDG